MTPKLYKAGEVCELLQVQPYVLRSWEKEFPGIGVQGKSADSPRLYRQSDLEHVQKIKRLVFGEGLTVAGARRKLEAETPSLSLVSEAEAAEVLDALGADVRARLAVVRDGLRELQSLLTAAPGSNGHAARGNAKAGGRTLSGAPTSRAPTSGAPTKRGAAASRGKTVTRGAARKVAAPAARRKASAKRRRV